MPAEYKRVCIVKNKSPCCSRCCKLAVYIQVLFQIGLVINTDCMVPNLCFCRINFQNTGSGEIVDRECFNIAQRAVICRKIVGIYIILPFPDQMSEGCSVLFEPKRY